MTKKIPLEIKEDEVKTGNEYFSFSAKIPKKYRKYMKYIALIVGFAAIYFGYTLSI
jgi:hypothetical protein